MGEEVEGLIYRLRKRGEDRRVGVPNVDIRAPSTTHLLDMAANTIESLRASLTRAEEETAWQPIETAPRDETWIELWWPDTEAKVHAGFWSDTGPNDWYRSEADSHPMRVFLDGEPTHWRAIRDPEVLSRDSASTGKAAPE